MNPVCLITSYYKDKVPERQKELDLCVQNNIENNKIDSIILVLDKKTPIPFKSDKITIINLGKRPDYRHVFNIASTFNSNGINILSNTDIYWKEEDIELIKGVDLSSSVLALSRWDVMYGGTAKHFARPDSQDSWIWYGKMKSNVNCDFQFGKAGCDNRIARELFVAGYNVINCSKQIKSYHLHLSNIRNYNRDKPEDVIPPPYKLLPIENIEIEKNGIIYTNNPVAHGGEFRVLHVALHSLGVKQNAMVKCIKSLGSKYVDFDWIDQKRLYGTAKMQENLVRLSAEYNPHFTFLQIQGEGILDTNTVKRLKGITMNWTGDVRQPLPNWFLQLGKYFTITSFTNEHDVNYMRCLGYNSEFLQVGYDPAIYREISSESNCPEIVFMANNYNDRFPLSSIRYNIANVLRQRYGERFGLYGNGWDFPAQNLNRSPKGEATVYSNCKIAINCSHFDLSRYSSDRLFRIMGAGAFCLTKWYPDFDTDFKDGVHLRVFHSIEEMLDLIDYYIAHPDERKKIQKAGTDLVRNHHTWEARRKDFVEIINKYSSIKIK